jgi:hypothetical protein
MRYYVTTTQCATLEDAASIDERQTDGKDFTNVKYWWDIFARCPFTVCPPWHLCLCVCYSE